eukprot:Gb_02213 [translate_table: standard]
MQGKQEMELGTRCLVENYRQCRELGTGLSFGRCKSRERMQDKQEMELGTRCLAENYRQCSHKSNYDACGSAHGRLDYRGAGNDGCHHRGRSRLRARSAITCKCGGVRCSGNRLRKRSRSNTYYRSSSSESDRRSADSFCRNCDSVFKYCSSVHETEKQTHKLNLVCSSHGFIHTSSTNVHKHSYSHCRQRVVRSNHGLCSCPYRKRQHKNYSIDHDVDASMFRRRSEPIWCKHRTRYHKLGSASPHGICQGKPQEDRKCSPFGPVACKSKVVSPMRGCTKHTCFPYLAHNVQPADVCAVGHVEITSESKEGSLNINREWNGLFTSCTNGNSEVINAQTEKQKHQDQWLQLSLKAPQHSKLMVEGVSKSDLKLSLPEVTRQSNMEDCIPCGSSEMRTRKQIGGNECSNPTSAIDFQNRSRRMDPSLYHQPMENLYYLNVQHASSSVPDLNLSPKILNVCSGIIAPVTWSKAELDPPQNCHDSHAREEPNLLVLNHRNWGSSEYEENVPVFKHADVQNPKFPHNEELRGLHLGGISYPHFKATSISGAADCGNESNMPVQNNLVGTYGKDSMADEISADESEVSDLQDTLCHGNVLGTAIEFNKEGREDELGTDFDLRGPSCSQSRNNLGQQKGSVIHLPKDNCRTIEIISSEDESADNKMPSEILLPENSKLQESGQDESRVDVAVRGLENDTVGQEKLFHDESDNSHQAVDHFEEGQSIRGFRSQENNASCTSGSTKDNGNIKAVYGNKGKLGTSNGNLVDQLCIEALLQIANSKNRNWDSSIVCDLCGQGPSLMYGEWYAWCCGFRLSYCECTEDHKRKLLLSMKNKKGKASKKWSGHEWSGKVHRMCGLWSSEVFEKDDAIDQLEGLLDAVKRGKSLICAECKRFGATLGCRVKKCKRSFHYTCADWLSSQLRCRMWEGCSRPIACYSHRHVDNECATAKESKSNVNLKYRNNLVNASEGNRNTTAYLQKISCEDINSHQNALMTEDVNINNGEISKATAGDVDDVGVRQCLAKSFKNKTGSGPTSSKESVLDLKYDKARTDKYMGTSFRKGHNAYNPQYLGQNLICEDISHGTEAVKISCTNDIDNASFPTFEYIHENRFSAQATVILESVLSNTEKQAKACEGCDEFDMDDPEAAISVHIPVNECKRDQDKRIDWQGEPMLGRLPYDRCGRLQLGSGTPDVVECNSKCPCGSNCLNCELQKGLQVSLEVFRTEDNEWGVRALEQIPRGKFVVEYVGEVLSQGEANKHVLTYDKYNFRYLFSMDHPAVPQEDHLVVDIFRMSNVARFINHSCAGNLSIYRVYTEILDQRIFRLGMYACRDIELGEELTYDYKYVPIQNPGI